MENEPRTPHGTGTRHTLRSRGMFLHAWDIAEAGADPLMDWLSSAGLNTLCLAATYHDGWFVHPHHSRHRALMAEGDVCYFHPRLSLYRDTRLRPQVARICQKRDWFAEAGKKLRKYHLRLVSWTVGTHNSRLGLKYPDLVQQNVFGDRLPHALCPANDEARAYLIALCRDLAVNYPVSALQLESFGWMGFRHGHHHERDLTGLSDFECELLGLCVCRACRRKAAAAGVDAEKVRTQVKSILDGVFREAPGRPRGHPTCMEEAEASYPELKRFNAWRTGFQNFLLSEIRARSLAGTDCLLLLQTEPERTTAGLADGFACIAYRQTPARTLEICRRANRKLPRNWSGWFQCFVQLGMGVLASESQLRGIVRAVQKGGCNGISFYNYSEAPPKMLNWLAAVMKEFAG